MNGSPPKLLDLSFTHQQSVVEKIHAEQIKIREKNRNTQQFLDSSFFGVPKFGELSWKKIAIQEMLGIPTNFVSAATNLCVPQNPWLERIPSPTPQDLRDFSAVS